MKKNRSYICPSCRKGHMIQTDPNRWDYSLTEDVYWQCDTCHVFIDDRELYYEKHVPWWNFDDVIPRKASKFTDTAYF